MLCLKTILFLPYFSIQEVRLSERYAGNSTACLAGKTINRKTTWSGTPRFWAGMLWSWLKEAHSAIVLLGGQSWEERFQVVAPFQGGPQPTGSREVGWAQGEKRWQENFWLATQAWCSQMNSIHLIWRMNSFFEILAIVSHLASTLTWFKLVLWKQYTAKECVTKLLRANPWGPSTKTS